MRNKIFLAVIGVMLVSVLVYAPIHTWLMQAGIIEYNNVGNVISVDRVYAEDELLADELNAIEEAKRSVVDTYTNHIPFYLALTDTATAFKRSLNEPMTKALQSAGDKIIRAKLKK